MQVCKRNGEYVDVSFDKITRRIAKLSDNLDVDPIIVAKDVCHQIIDGIKTSEIDKISSIVAQEYTTTNPDYSKLAGRISISNLQKNTKSKFSEYMELIYENDLITDKIINIVKNNKERLDNAINEILSHHLQLLNLLYLWSKSSILLIFLLKYYLLP